MLKQKLVSFLLMLSVALQASGCLGRSRGESLHPKKALSEARVGSGERTSTERPQRGGKRGATSYVIGRQK